VYLAKKEDVAIYRVGVFIFSENQYRIASHNCFSLDKGSKLFSFTEGNIENHVTE
jgi:hypothetical protein